MFDITLLKKLCVKWTFIFCITGLSTILHQSVCSIEHDDFVLVTPPKTGTHLAIALLESLLDKQEKFILGFSINREKLIEHLDFTKAHNRFIRIHAMPTDEMIQTLKDKNYKVIFTWRDPRDQAVSLLFFILDPSKHFAYGPMARHRAFGKLSFDDQLLEVITGCRFGCSATKEMMGGRIPWLHQDPEFLYTTRYEDLVGSQGGGNDKKQITEIMNIASFLNLNMSREEILARTKHIYGQGRTFRSGHIGEWRKYFKPQHIKGFKEVFGQELIDTGYEKNFNW